MKNYNIFTIATENYQDVIKLMFTSLKYWKRKNSKYTIYLYVDSQNIDYFNKELQFLNNNDFEIKIISCIPYKNLIHSTINLKWSYLVYFRLLAFKLFSNLDKILMLDCDTIVMRQGLEQFMDEDIDDYYINAVLDAPVSYCTKLWSYGYEERKQCKTKNYFNSGVCNFNLKKIRQDKKDIELAKAAIQYPKTLKCFWPEQTVLNYTLRNKVKIGDPKFNNMTLVTLEPAIKDFKKQIKIWNYKSFEDLLDKTIILHFAGPNKPWKDDKCQNYPYFYLAKQKYEQLKQLYEKEIK